MVHFISLCLVLTSLTSVAWGCGVLVHIEVANKALKYSSARELDFAAMLSQERDAVFAGAPFPDWLYQCGNNHNAGEYTHWHPFHFEFVNRIRHVCTAEGQLPSYDKLPPHCRKLIAFFMGALAHYTADNTWHGLGYSGPYGLIQHLGLQNWGCRGNLCPEAHNAADIGAEFVVGHQLNIGLSGSTRKWWVPAGDISAILAKAEGGRYATSTATLSRCMVQVAAERIVLRSEGQRVFAYFAAKSPMLHDALLEHWVGGIDEMAVRTVQLWEIAFGWIKHGNPTNSSSLETQQQQQSGNATKSVFRSKNKLPDMSTAQQPVAPMDDPKQCPQPSPLPMGEGGPKLGKLTSDAHHLLSESEDGSRVHVTKMRRRLQDGGEGGDSDPLKQKLDGVIAQYADMLGVSGDLTTGAVSVSAKPEVLQMAAAIAQQRKDGDSSSPSSEASEASDESTAAAAAEYSNVVPAELELSREQEELELLGELNDALVTLDDAQAVLDVAADDALAAGEEQQLTSRGEDKWRDGDFGYEGGALSSCDLDGDGKDDLVVGLPGASFKECGALCGSVRIEFSSGRKMVVRAASPMGRFGSALACVDFDTDGRMDLAIAAPTDNGAAVCKTECERQNYRGAVTVLFSDALMTLAKTAADGKVSVSELAAASVTVLRGRTPWENFGHTLLAADVDQDGFADLLVGSPWAPSPSQHLASIRASGNVAVFRSAKGRRGAQLQPYVADGYLEGTAALGEAQLFGWSVCATHVQHTALQHVELPSGLKDAPTVPLVVVGAPTLQAPPQHGMNETRGGVYVFALGKGAKGDLESVLLATLHTTTRHAFFGASCAVTAGDTLVVGAPGSPLYAKVLLPGVKRKLQQAGAAHLVPLLSLIGAARAAPGGMVDVDAVPGASAVWSPRPGSFGKVGWRTAVLGPRGDVLVVTGPYGEMASGTVLVFQMKGDGTAERVKLIKGAAQSRLGWSVACRGCGEGSKRGEWRLVVGAPKLSGEWKTNRQEGGLLELAL